MVTAAEVEYLLQISAPGALVIFPLKTDLGKKNRCSDVLQDGLPKAIFL